VLKYSSELRMEAMMFSSLAPLRRRSVQYASPWGSAFRLRICV
jgi:hypothetical protein